MFYFDELEHKKILRSDYLEEINVFFTTKTDNPSNTFPFAISNLVMPTQTHSDNIQIVTHNKNHYDNTDALIISNKHHSIALRFADCTPLVFYDTKKNIGAIAHAGWRGTVAKIGVKTISTMQKQFDSNVHNIIALIGPAIGVCCYEVSRNVQELLLSTVKDASDLYEKNNVNLKKINARQLEEIGIQKIDICPYCTSCDNDLFYSYRKENGTSFRHFAYMSLTKPEK